MISAKFAKFRFTLLYRIILYFHVHYILVLLYTMVVKKETSGVAGAEGGREKKATLVSVCAEFEYLWLFEMCD